MPKTAKTDTEESAEHTTQTQDTYYVGANLGHGYTKYAVIKNGQIWKLIEFPSQIVKANAQMAGGLIDPPPSVLLGEQEYWYGYVAARHSRTVQSNLTQERLEHPSLLPVLALGALNELDLSHLNGNTNMYLASGLPATQVNKSNASALAGKLRSVMPWLGQGRILVTAEPLGAIMEALLNNNGETVGDEALTQGTVGMFDLGLGTFDIGLVESMQTLTRNFNTWDELGVSGALGVLRAKWSSDLQMDLSLLQVDRAIRDGGMRVAGSWWSIPDDWKVPFRELGEAMVARVQEVWGKGNHIDVMLAAGGGAAIEPLMGALQSAYPRVRVAENPQHTVSIGYARRAVKLSKEQQ